MKGKRNVSKQKNFLNILIETANLTKKFLVLFQEITTAEKTKCESNIGLINFNELYYFYAMCFNQRLSSTPSFKFDCSKLKRLGKHYVTWARKIVENNKKFLPVYSKLLLTPNTGLHQSSERLNSFWTFAKKTWKWMSSLSSKNFQVTEAVSFSICWRFKFTSFLHMISNIF